MSNQAIQKVEKEPVSVEYVPFGNQDKIKLSVQIVQNLVAVKTKSGKTCSQQDAIKFLAMCQARRLNPFEGDAYLIGYDGKDGPQFSLITAHQTYLKRAELNTEFDGMKSGIIVREEDGTMRDLEGDFFVEGQTLLGGWATVFFKNRKQPMHKRIRLARFKKNFGVWLDDPAGMICKCAEADALRSSFPTMLGGLFLREELQIQGDGPKTSTPIFSTPATATVEAGPAVETTREPAPASREPDAEPEPEPPPRAADPVPAPEPPTGGMNPIKAVRGLCRQDNIPELTVIEFAVGIGLIDGNPQTFEEVQLQFPEALKTMADKWSSVSASIREAKGSK